MKINLCGIGDPKNPKIWSGTPYNILNELTKKGNLGSAFDSRITNKLFKLLELASMFYYTTKAGAERGKLIRHLNANKSIFKTNQSISNHTLHLGTGDLPFNNLPNNQHHYLFCDSTWKLWSTHATNMRSYSKQIIDVAEALEKRSYEQVEHIFSISHYVKENLITHYKIPEAKVTVVGTGTGIIKPYFGSKDYSNGKILFAAKGRFKDKGGDLVLKAFKIALETNKNLHLSIVGQNEYTSNIHHPNISTYGFIPVSQLQEMFDSHSLFLMPALNEPWGLVYIEAMLCKMPIVGLNRNSFPELSGYGKYGVAINKVDANALADCILRLTANTALMEKMGTEAQSYCIDNFTWEKTVARIVKQIEIIAGSPIYYKLR